MPHYQDGTPAQIGDIVKGQGYNVKHEIIGKVLDIKEETSCNLTLVCISQDSQVYVGDGKKTWGWKIDPTIEYGECAKFVKIAALLLAMIFAAPAAKAQTQPIVLIGNASAVNMNLPLNTGAELWRDFQNGQWRGGGYFDPFGFSYGAISYGEIGIAQSWTANNGSPGYGVHLGINGLNVINQTQQLLTKYDLAAAWKPFNTVSNWVRFNVNYQILQNPPPGGNKNAWGLGVDVNVPVSTVMGWIEKGI